MIYNSARTLLIAVFTVLGIITATGARIIDNPFVSFSNTATIDITQVELTDSNTILTVKAFYRPKWWIRIAGDTYLRADNKSYSMTDTQGIEPGEKFWMPESGEAQFKLFFEPLPADSKEFDFMEGNDPSGFRLLGVDLTGSQTPADQAGFPVIFKKGVKDGILPAPILEVGETTVNYHLIPSGVDLPFEIIMYVNTIDGMQNELRVPIDEDGNGSITFDQYGPVRVYVILEHGEHGTRTGTTLTLQPGENIDYYLDTRITGWSAMSHRKNISRNDYNVIAHTGVYNDLDRLTEKRSFPLFRLNLYSGEFADYRSTGEEYKNMVKAKYDAYSDSILNSGAPQMLKEYSLLALQNDVLEAIANYKYFLMHNFRSVKNNWDRTQPIPEDSIPGTLTDEDFAEVATWFDVSNPKLLLAGSNIGQINWNSHGVKGDLSKSVNLYSRLFDKAKKMKLEQSDIDTLKTLSNPFFAAACDTMNQRTIRQFEALAQNVKVTPTPDVPADRIFDAIVGEHKGKVVVIDLWNTWCGPCRQALKGLEPLKTGKLAKDDIVWIYIADESSDPISYLNLLPTIKGIHYKLTREQMKMIYDRFEVDGIPFYILVDREGNAERRPDMRNHDTYIEAIQSKL